jgi:hypothetical protein
MMAAPRAFALVAVARECPVDGQYRRVESATESATLTLDARTLTLDVGGRPLLHLPLPSCTCGVLDDRLLVVPSVRAPAWLLQLPCAATAAADALRVAGCVVQPGACGLVTAAPLTDADLEAAAATPGFKEMVADMEAALARRCSLGLPELLV